MNDSSSRQLIFIITIALGLLMLLSAIPWSNLTGNTLKDFNLLSDLFSNERPVLSTQPVLTSEIEEVLNEEIPEVTDSASAIVNEAVVPVPVQEVQVEAAPVINGIVAIENYTGGELLSNFRNALSQASVRTVRVAVIGDSFIEGDIFSQDLRSMLRENYGGSGIGFSALHSDFPGFRRTVKMKTSGWELHDIRTMAAKDSLRLLSGDYAVSSGNATTIFTSGSAGTWARTTLVYLATDSGSVSVATESAEKTITAIPSTDIQSISIDGSTNSAKITASHGVIALGAYLDSTSGIQVDCMSIRGNSGLPMRKLNRNLSTQMRNLADYDLIILEYGTNAVSAGQTDYSGYAQAMVRSVERIRSSYPAADILIMGIADRGEKVGTEVSSMAACAAMVNSQRELARKTGTAFWDTRAAMGGENSVVEWRNRKLVNADYTHLNKDGGRELARLLFNALNLAVNE